MGLYGRLVTTGLDPLMSVGAVLLVLFVLLSWLARRVPGLKRIGRVSRGFYISECLEYRP